MDEDGDGVRLATKNTRSHMSKSWKSTWVKIMSNNEQSSYNREERRRN
jgi:hypothetical protein